MAITTLDGALAGALNWEKILKVGAAMEAAGVLHSLFYTAGRPGAAVAPSPGLAGAALTTYSGQIPFTNPASGNTHLGWVKGSASATGSFLVADRLWHNSGLVVATLTAQTINSVAWPARCPPASGLPSGSPTTDGDDVTIGIEVSTATTNAGAITNTTMSYTNQAGTAGRTATIASFPATAVAGTFVPFLLQAGDTGVRSIQTVTLGTSYAGGAIHLVAYREFASLGISVPNVEVSLNPITGGFGRCYDNTVPFPIWLASAVTATTFSGSIKFTQG